ncbi:hypothetical protein HDV05_005740 [Chytridiales sp. JEL 0842]|nr:hypothetical protein HDV05_005740 [Chytridiales sp. JEL 0842]
MTIIKSFVKDIVIPDVDVHTAVFTDPLRTNPSRLNNVAYIDAPSGTKRTYKQLVEDIDALALGLYESWGFKKWDCVGIYSGNHLDYPVAVHAIIKAGGTVSPANPTYLPSELLYQLKDSGAKYVITSSALLPAALEAASGAGIPRERILLFDGAHQGLKGLRDLFSKKGGSVKVAFTKDELWSMPAYLCYSSGTTGRSKGVQTTHRNLVSNLFQTIAFEKFNDDHTPNDVFVGVLPFYHIYGLNLSLHFAPFCGHTVVVVPKFELEPFLGYLSKYNVGLAHIVPPIALAFAKHPIVDKFKFPKLRALCSGAAPLSGDLVHAIKARLGINTVQGYGMTELSPIAIFSSTKKVVPGSSGFLMPNMEAKLVDPSNGQEISGKDLIGKEGELWLRGPNVMKGYHNNEKATKETIDEEGWLHTGDIAVMDKDGYFYIVDRIKELIKYKGLQVAPAELEAHLLTHPSVADAAVIGRPDEAAGEVPRAYVVLKPGAETTKATDIQDFIQTKVAQHKRLRGGVKFIDAIPKAASGKILRRVLRDQDTKERLEEQKTAKAKL